MGLGLCVSPCLLVCVKEKLNLSVFAVNLHNYVYVCVCISVCLYKCVSEIEIESRSSGCFPTSAESINFLKFLFTAMALYL